MPRQKHERSPSQDVLKHPSTKRAKEINGPDNPYDELLQRIEKANKAESEVKPRNILHWFRSKDLRAEDNRALHAASQTAKKGKGALLTCFLFSPRDLEWHGTSPARSDFMLEGLKLLQAQLGALNIPLLQLTAEDRGEKAAKIAKLVREHDVSHVFANIEYEVDELRRDLDLFEKLGKEDVQLVLHHDQTILEPRKLVNGSGAPHKVFTPYYKMWLKEVSGDPSLFDTVEAPAANDENIKVDYKDFFDQPIPELPKDKQFASEDERERIRKLWPAGHAAGMKRLQDFLGNKVQSYATNRSTPAADNSSRLSPYFAAGTISVREALCAAHTTNSSSADFSSAACPAGLSSWVREVVFREFYRHMMCVTPHKSLNLPQNLKFDFVEWEDDEEGWKKWCEGKTGVPFVDAGMRQLNTEAYMHNRLRMNTSSYLRTNLLIDYRRGERYFVEHLVDWDLCNNTQGWEPSYTVFNPVVQAEKCDPQGKYIRKWVPELRDVKGKAVFDPFARLSREEFDKLGYPQPHVDYKESKERCIQRYKHNMADAEP
ncbi:deoxyribodipyrimidine photo-lyase [Pseudomassariella vexata]|uniref:Deoxyribodipyrimidine photo-lyase n=1 Tax=Pseudomassariella vexata TaxID=1141098 RepID=A0A1Y2ED69_9PEZI|nr:deoxyribodipyrimidine photo-lyase [Pseudomassariella vexata]ORY69518.1 deoxyribodipyrimidine photo-lyase [Pseudomassariella vexata]